MSPKNNERRYTREEFALVLRLASDLEEGGEGTSDQPSPLGGLTLSQMREIAAEVGIDPAKVSRAAGILPSKKESGLIRLLGGWPRNRLEHTVPGRVPEKDLGRIIEVARRTLGVQGETREVLGSVEWNGSTSSTRVSVSASPREGETTLQASTDRTDSLMGIYAGAGLGVLGVVSVTMGKLVFGETDAGILAAFLSGIPPAFLFCRALWKRSTRKWRERLVALMDAMAREAEASVEAGEE